MYSDVMVSMYPQIEVDPDVLFVQDGRIITSAGTAAGLDACLHLLRQEIGAELTNRVARRMVVPPQRDGGQAQYIDRPIPVVQSNSLAVVTDWAMENLSEELTVDQLAARAHMSARTFARRFKAEHGATPAAWLARQRIIHAQRMLERTELGLDAIAEASGFGSAAVLRQNFARVLGTTPTAYRATFSCTRDESAA
jgi:transcriptional regulator GlxA family with amidase domain